MCAFLLGRPGVFSVKALGINTSDDILTRGEAVALIVDGFNLEKKYGTFIHNCLNNTGECFFVFSAMSDYDGIRFKPLILYPDVFPAHPYAKKINVATILGLVHGHLEVKSTPFYPQEAITRIEVLRVMLEAADLMKWKEKFELTNAPVITTGFEDIDDSTDTFSWWYSRYIQYALEAKIVKADHYFKPNEPIAKEEFDSMLKATLSLIPIENVEND